MKYQYTNQKLDSFQELIGQALLDGTFQELDGERQMELFVKGYNGQPHKLLEFAKNLGSAKKRGLINFDPADLVERAQELIPKPKKQPQQSKLEGVKPQPQQSPIVMQQPMVAVSQQQPMYQPQSVAANDVKIGFNPMRFVGETPQSSGDVPLSVVNPTNRVVSGNTNSPLTPQKPKQIQTKKVKWPDDYNILNQSAKCDVIRTLINSGELPPINAQIFDDMADDEVDLADMKRILNKFFTFVPGAHSGFDEIQMEALGMLITYPKLAFKMKEYRCTDLINEPKFLEVSVEDYASNLADRYDFAFLLKTTDKTKAMLVLLNSVPLFDERSRKWYISTTIQDVSFGKTRRNPFYPKKKVTQQPIGEEPLTAPISEVIEVEAKEVTA